MGAFLPQNLSILLNNVWEVSERCGFHFLGATCWMIDFCVILSCKRLSLLSISKYVRRGRGDHDRIKTAIPFPVGMLMMKKKTTYRHLPIVEDCRKIFVV